MHVNGYSMGSIMVGDGPKPSDLCAHPYQFCWYCGRLVENIRRPRPPDHARTVDHVVPVSRGGYKHTPNVVVACLGCNKEKGDLDLEEYRKMKGVGLFWGEMHCPSPVSSAKRYPKDLRAFADYLKLSVAQRRAAATQPPDSE